VVAAAGERRAAEEGGFPPGRGDPAEVYGEARIRVLKVERAGPFPSASQKVTPDTLASRRRSSSIWMAAAAAAAADRDAARVVADVRAARAAETDVGRIGFLPVCDGRET